LISPILQMYEQRGKRFLKELEDKQPSLAKDSHFMILRQSRTFLETKKQSSMKIGYANSAKERTSQEGNSATSATKIRLQEQK